jgi:SAM-dependent methyltransferase
MPSPAPPNSPAAERNKGPILAELQRLLPASGRMLEIAAGTGQHAQHMATALPQWQWQPTDPAVQALQWIAQRIAAQALPNLQPPLQLDVLAEPWPLPDDRPFDAVFCANMLHIAPWACCGALMRGAAQWLAPGGKLITYGPYFVQGEAPAPGNTDFDTDLRARNPAWGIRWLHEVQAEAAAAGLQFVERVAMPANNLVLVFRR